MPRRTDLSKTFCPVGRAAELLGDRAVLLILRELFFGVRRFEAIAANTGLGPQLVSARLKRLVAEGIVTRHEYQPRPPRYDYRLTDKGKDLFGVLYALRGWAERWVYAPGERSEEHTSELQSLMRISYAVFCLKKKRKKHTNSDMKRV